VKRAVAHSIQNMHEPMNTDIKSGKISLVVPCSFFSYCSQETEFMI